MRVRNRAGKRIGGVGSLEARGWKQAFHHGLNLRLIGMTEMNPAPHRGHKVLIKGLLIKDADGSRVNVTSIKTVGDLCGK